MLYLYMFSSVLLNILSQIIIKSRVNIYGSIPNGLFEKLKYFQIILADYYIWFAIFLAFLQAFFWIAALSKADLSFAGPMITAIYMVLTLVLAVIIFEESANILKVLGVSTITVGILILSLSR